ncbi:sortase [Candidatus Uhrbacteria bacterium]|nr:sortase [Candidatus Uhrbacteria bacterium]
MQKIIIDKKRLFIVGLVLIFFLAWQYGGYALVRLSFFLHPPTIPPQEEEILLPDEPTKIIRLPSYIYIDRLGIAAPILRSDGRTETEIQRLLHEGTVNLSGTALAGGVGNMVVVGHSSDFAWVKPSEYRYVFANLPEAKFGDQVLVTDAEGNVFVYVVEETKIVPPTAMEILDQDFSTHRLTLQTSYPLGTALKRFVVVASLTVSEEIQEGSEGQDE